MNFKRYWLAPSEIRKDPACQVRTGALDAEHVARLREAYDDGEEVPVIRGVRTDQGTYLYDGFHRLAAQADSDSVPIDCTDGDLELAKWLALGTNPADALPLTRAEKVRKVDAAIETGRDKSDRELAAHCGVSHTFVAKRRRAMQQQAAADSEPTSAPNDGETGNNATPRDQIAGDDGTEPATPPPPPKPPKGERGWAGGDDVPEKYRVLPPHLIAEWDRAHAVVEAVRAIHATEADALSGMTGGVFQQVLVQEAVGWHKAVETLLDTARPWSLCPRCRGQFAVMGACKACKGTGIVVKGVWEALPRGVKL